MPERIVAIVRQFEPITSREIACILYADRPAYRNTELAAQNVRAMISIMNKRGAVLEATGTGKASQGYRLVNGAERPR